MARREEKLFKVLMMGMITSMTTTKTTVKTTMTTMAKMTMNTAAAKRKSPNFKPCKPPERREIQ
jgi:hypothetical protein